MNSCFNLPQDFKQDSEDKIDIWFKSVKDKSVLHISFDYNSNYKFVINSESMEVVGELVQDMCSFIGIKNIGAEADFNAEMDKFKETLNKIQSLTDNTVTQITSITDDIANLKQMMVSVEDSRSM